MQRPRAMSAIWLLSFLLLAGGAGGQDVPGPRPITDVEVRATELGLDYLQDGGSGWWTALAKDSPYRRLGEKKAIAEIEVRAGPPLGARWTLTTPAKAVADHLAIFTIDFPSGTDETLVLEFRRGQAGSLDLQDLWTYSEPPPSARGRQASGKGGAIPKQEVELAKTRPSPAASSRLPAYLLLGLSLATLGGALFLRRKPRLAAGLAVAALALGGFGTFLLLVGDSPQEVPQPRDRKSKTSPIPLLADFSELRQEMAFGTQEHLELPAAKRGEDPRVADTLRLWTAQHAFSLTLKGLERATELLEPLAFDHPALGVRLLRARIALLQSQRTRGAFLYGKLVEDPNAQDGLWLEAYQGQDFLDFNLDAEKTLELAAAAGTRDADVYYALVTQALMKEDLPAAARLFRVGWQLSARDRASLLRSPGFGYLLDDPEIRQLLTLDSATEPMVRLPRTSSRAISLPEGVEAQLASGFLRFRIADALLYIPGGAEIAPVGTPLLDASAWKETLHSEALADLDGLVLQTRAPGAFAKPGLHRRLTEAAEALAEQDRWQELASLTEVLGPRDIETAPLYLVRLRAVALRRLGRNRGARSLLLALAKSARTGERKDPYTLLQLADVLSEEGELELAARLVNRAESLLPFFDGRPWLARLRMDQKLGSSYKTLKVPHFELRYPPDRRDYLTTRLAGVLEAEQKRLSKWIPLTDPKTVEVHLLPFEEFMETFSGSVEIIGLYDGRIRLPMADLGGLNDEIVSIMSHELAHAMIAEATAEKAPKWFHEGLARHIEMVGSTNSMPYYARTSGLLTFSLIEPVLEGFSHPSFVAQAYDEACWTMRYIETKYGVRAIHRLAEAFKEGASTEAAIRQVFHLPVADFDRQMRRWWLEEAPPGWATDRRDYRLNEDDALIRRSG